MTQYSASRLDHAARHAVAGIASVERLCVGTHVQVVSSGPGCIEIVRTDALIAKYAGSLPWVYNENYLEKLRGERE